MSEFKHIQTLFVESKMPAVPKILKNRLSLSPWNHGTADGFMESHQFVVDSPIQYEVSIVISSN